MNQFSLARRVHNLALIALASFLFVHPTFTSAQRPKQVPHPDEGLMLRSFAARSIGPAVMSGRVSDIAINPDDSYTFYLGLGTGGIMKTSDNGGTFSALFEGESVASIGAVAISPANSKIVWVGTGEANDRNSSSWGNGVYLSTDGGGSWKNMGLKDSRTIARIIPHPADTNIAWVAAMGDMWNPNTERGLYKTTDMGKSWKAILTAPGPHNKWVGCGDIAIDPSNPQILYSALYARQRTPWSFSYGSSVTGGKDLGGIFKSTDGGSTWSKLTSGLPGNTGRIGLAVYKKEPKIVYAVVQSDEGGTSGIDQVKSKQGGVFRSDNAGETWTRVNPLNPRPFYFSQIRVDPENEKRVYVLGFLLHVSDDGGQTFQENFFDKVHPDCHALAIDQKNPKRILLGTDGGAYQSFAGGKGWRHLNNFAAGEFYRISLDMSTPYRIAGGLQDNLNWVGPSRTFSRDGILNSDWINIGGGDGFYCVFDPTDSNLVYAESQEGYVHRFNLATGESKGLRPEQEEGQEAYRFHWNSPLIGSKHEPASLYLAGNRIFKLKNKGERFLVISPDLSARNYERYLTVGSGAENYGVVYAFAESPVTPGLLWAGTDDGKLWITDNDGGTWTDLTRNLPQVAKEQWLTRIEASSFDPKAAYLVVDAHRTGNFAPLVFRTTDQGRRWHSIAGDLPKDGPVKVLREDPKNPQLLFAGTEFGLFVTRDQGRHWTKFGKLPTVAVDDIQIHPRDCDLVVATHGRSIYIIDDIRPLRELVDSVLDKEAHLFSIEPACARYTLPGFSYWEGNAVFRGANPPEGAVINFYVRDFTGESARISVADSAGKAVANMTVAAGPGINRTTWDLQWSREFMTEYGGEGQRFVKPGDYTVTLNYGKATSTQVLHVDVAPGIETK